LQSLSSNAELSRNLPAPELARALVERSLEGADRRDDSLALVVRHCGPVLVDAPSGFGHRAMPVAEQVPVVRHQFLAWISQQDDMRSLGADLAVAVSELATNAVRVAHAYFEVRATIAGGGVVIEVEDDGPGFEETGLLGIEPNLESESGRGLFIVKSLVDEMLVRSTGRGCVVRLFKKMDGTLDGSVGANETSFSTTSKESKEGAVSHHFDDDDQFEADTKAGAMNVQAQQRHGREHDVERGRVTDSVGSFEGGSSAG
jgi:serine/threonine-protein kinase RsbW